MFHFGVFVVVIALVAPLILLTVFPVAAAAAADGTGEEEVPVCINMFTPSVACRWSNIRMDPTLTEVADSAFDDNKELTGVDFSNCSLLSSVGSRAFYGNQIAMLDLPITVTTIGDLAFANNKISTLNMPGASSIGWSSFNYNKISHLVVPASVTSIGKNAFANNPIVFACYEGDSPPSPDKHPSYFGIKAGVTFGKCVQDLKNVQPPVHTIPSPSSSSPQPDL